MIKLLTKGKYRLEKTKDRKKVLYLGEQGYLWSYAKGIGELLSFSKHQHLKDYLLAQGNYFIYVIKDEPEYVDLQHLELETGAGSRQGYLLLTGLPTVEKIRSRIVPTDEVIEKPQKERKIK